MTSLIRRVLSVLVVGLIAVAVTGCHCEEGDDAELLGGSIPYNNPNYAVEAGDLDNDKDIDDDILILDRPNKTLTVVLNGTTTYSTVYSLPKGSTDVVIADVAGDAWDDAVILARDKFNTTTTVRVLVNQGVDADGAWLGFVEGPLSSYSGSTFEFVSAGEFDAKPGTDLFVFNRKSRRFAVASGDQAGKFTLSRGERLEPNYLVLTVRELDLVAPAPNASGSSSTPEYPDIVLLNEKTGVVSVHKNQMDGTFSPPLPTI